MPRIDELVAQIPDTALQQELKAALADREHRRPFGLVYDEHIPETVALSGLPIRRGATVVRRTDSEEKRRFLVKNIGPRRRIELEPEGGGALETAAAGELLVVTCLGDPIFPALRSLGAVRRGPADRPHHALINGENFHALQLLGYLYEGQVDCIYIDPPYNARVRDWRYSGRYVDETDDWRHGKWLSMMEKRLRLARRLLKPDGVLICTIDEHEVHHLGMLLQDLFRRHLHYMVTIVINPKGREKANFAPVEEFAFFVVPQSQDDIIARAPMEEGERNEEADTSSSEEPEGPDETQANSNDVWEYRHARRRGGGAESSSYRAKRWKEFYPIYIDETNRKVVRVGESLPLGKKPDMRRKDGLRPIWPIDKEGRERCWAFVPKSMQKLIDQGDVLLGRYHRKRDDWTINYRVPKKATRKLKTVWWQKSHDAGTHGTHLLTRLLGAQGLFAFPKSVYAVRDCLAAVVRNRPNALILDFFAGSATTFHATCLLNAEYPGARRSILVTNNEVEEGKAGELNKHGLFRSMPEFEKHGIFERVARPRCEAVLTGRRRDGSQVPGKDKTGRAFAAGFAENLEFFQIDYLDRDEVDLRRQFHALYPALWLAADGVGKRRAVTKDPDMLVPADAPYAILLREEKLARFLEMLKERPDIRRVWIVTDSENAFAEIRARLPSGISASMLYRDYLRNVAADRRKSR